MTEEFEEYKEFKEEKGSFWKSISPWTVIILLIIIIPTYYIFLGSNAGRNEFIGLIIIICIALYIISQSGSNSQTNYINSETAREILLDWIKNYTKLRKEGVCKISLPKGFVEIGLPAKEFNPFDMKTPKSWQIGFTIEDESEEGLPKYFLAKIDPIMGGDGLEEIQKLESEFLGIVKPIAKEKVPIPADKYFELPKEK